MLTFNKQLAGMIIFDRDAFDWEQQKQSGSRRYQAWPETSALPLQKSSLVAAYKQQCPYAYSAIWDTQAAGAV